MKKSEYVIVGPFTPFPNSWLRKWLRMPPIPRAIDVMGRCRANVRGSWRFGTVGKVAEELGFSERRTRDAIHYLKDQGEIRLFMTPGRTDGRMEFVNWPLRKKGDREQMGLPLEPPNRTPASGLSESNRTPASGLEQRMGTGVSSADRPKSQEASQPRNRTPASGFAAISKTRLNTGGSKSGPPPRDVENQGGRAIANRTSGKRGVKGVSLISAKTSQHVPRALPDTNVDVNLDKDLYVVGFSNRGPPDRDSPGEPSTQEDRIFRLWQKQEIVVHREFRKDIRRKVKAAIKRFGVDTVEKAILIYGALLRSRDSIWTHKWTLDDFCQRGIKKFADLTLEEAMQSYRKETRARLRKPSTEWQPEGGKREI